ncbi:uncharacterized protein SPPG_01414 [Spizellomyces punctatus DAOM BR117]|uniref:Uncharacterized protein n=1 Tax=Spizellomyces punctatus (strain DAOM BR117) TaxID=645134 RepID=A0A0L0HS64_SPIPD|nr:uncharacterized protein SPPG_01414 [Spizellomyces punctatus DAOM BR117]KND03963.1 hypothetical protein SPPG_01414 [Spizellomyces punctatus DAOM BR117]|eukprot:XP_016612002.1 hypothetical protein SPPG_01414 [Spizellomyces punctatus DAOM BR117]
MSDGLTLFHPRASFDASDSFSSSDDEAPTPFKQGRYPSDAYMEPRPSLLQREVSVSSPEFSLTQRLCIPGTSGSRPSMTLGSMATCNAPSSSLQSRRDISTAADRPRTPIPSGMEEGAEFPFPFLFFEADHYRSPPVGSISTLQSDSVHVPVGMPLDVIKEFDKTPSSPSSKKLRRILNKIKKLMQKEPSPKFLL